MERLYGSICLSDIDKKQIKKVVCKDGVTRLYLNISVIERKAENAYGHTHFVSCAPKKEEREDGVKYIIGDLKRYVQQPNAVTPEQVAQAQSVSDDEDLPF